MIGELELNQVPMVLILHVVHYNLYFFPKRKFFPSSDNNLPQTASVDVCQGQVCWRRKVSKAPLQMQETLLRLFFVPHRRFISLIAGYIGFTCFPVWMFMIYLPSKQIVYLMHSIYMPNSDICSFIWCAQSGCLLLEEAAWKGWWYDSIAI